MSIVYAPYSCLSDEQLRATPVMVSIVAGVLPGGLASQALQTVGNTSLASIDTKLSNPVPVTGGLTDAELRASPVPVSLASGGATSALQTSGNAMLSSINTKLTAPQSVVGPLTDTELRASAIPVSNASLPLPTGAATSALQSTTNTSLASIDSKLSAPVAISAASLPLPAGASTEATLATLLTTAAFQARVPLPPTTGAITSVTVTTASVTALASNAARRGGTIFNDGDGYVYLAYGSTASATVFTARLSPNDYYEVGFGYTGILTAFRSTGSAPIRVTEVT